MKTISRYYNHLCTKKYQLLGFSKSKSTFVRRRGDVLHAFTLKYSRGIPTCSVEFGVFPLCLPQPIFLDAGGYELDEFVVERHVESSGWTFDPNSDASMVNCVESISEAIDLYLLPFFEVCSDCKSGLTELVKLEEMFDCNRKKALYLMGVSDRAVPWQERSLFDPRKFFMALKSHNLCYSKRYLQHQVDFCETKLRQFDAPNSPRQPDGVRQRFSDKLALHLEYLAWLESGDFSYFDDLLKSNEKQMIEYLADKYPQICSKQKFSNA